MPIIMRIISGVVLSFIVFLAWGCSGSNQIDASLHTQTPPVLESENSRQIECLVPVQMQPQQPKEFPDKSASWSSPAGLQSLLPAPDKVGSLRTDIAKNASAFESGLPSQNVAVYDSTFAAFTPGVIAGGSVADTMAYATYRFSLYGYYSFPSETLGYTWESPPDDFDHLWIGLSNRETKAWDWFAGDSDGVITIEDTSLYIDEVSNTMLMVVVVTEGNQCILDRLELGAYELRATGGIEDVPAVADPLPEPQGTLSSEVDLRGFCAPVSDQGKVPASTAFAVADGAYNYELDRIYRIYGWDTDNAMYRTSPRYLYVETGADQGLGCPNEPRNLELALDWLVGNGLSTAMNAPWGNPDDTDWCSQDWSPEALDDCSYLIPDGYKSFNPYGPLGVTAVKTVLCELRKPLILSLAIDLKFAINYDYYPGTWNYTGPTVGNHTLLIVGYNDSKEAFLVRNSWGEDWSYNGYCWIGYQTFHAGTPGMWCYYLEESFEEDLLDKFNLTPINLDAPQNVTASDEEYLDRIVVSWDPVDGADEYYIFGPYIHENGYRVEGQTSRTFFTANTEPRTYTVRADNYFAESELSEPSTGRIATVPVVSSVAPVDGNPGESVTFSANVSGTLPVTYSWNFGGGATPNTSTEASPAVSLTADGTYNGWVEVTNAFDSHKYWFAITVGTGGPDLRGDWNSWGRDDQNTRSSPFIGPQTSAVAWSYDTGSSISVSPVTAADGTVYIGNDDGYLHAINPDGSLRWVTPAEENYTGYSPAIGRDGTIYIVCADEDYRFSRLQALDSNGTQLWTMVQYVGRGHCPLIGPNGWVFSADASSLIAVNPDGSLAWASPSISGGGYVASAPAINHDGSFSLANSGNGLAMVSLSMGNLGGLWMGSRQVGGFVSSPAVGTDNTVYVGSTDGELFAVNQDCTLRWSYATGAMIESSPGIASDGTIYFGSDDHYIYALNPDGTLKWQYETGDVVDASPAIDAEGTVYINSHDGNFYAIGADGGLKWSYVTGGGFSSAAIGGDGTVYVGGMDGNFYAFGPGGS